MKNYKLLINHFAQNDIEKAREYFNDKKNALGDEFWKEVKAKLEQIEENPNKFQIIVCQLMKPEEQILNVFLLGFFFL